MCLIQMLLKAEISSFCWDKNQLQAMLLSPIVRAPPAPLRDLPTRWDFGLLIGGDGVALSSQPRCPFISGLGRCTPHLICGGANFSIQELRSGKNRKNSRLSHLRYFLEALTRPLWSLRFVLIPRLRLQKGESAFDQILSGRKLAVFVHSFDRLGPFVGTKHGSTNLQKRWERGGCRRKGSRRRRRGSEDKRTGRSALKCSRLNCSGGILSQFSNVLRQWRAPCCCSASPRSPAFRESGHMQACSPPHRCTVAVYSPSLF